MCRPYNSALDLFGTVGRGHCCSIAGHLYSDLVSC